MTAQDCIDTIRAAGNGRLSDEQIDGIVSRLQQEQARLKASGRVDDLAARLRDFARAEGERAKLAAALEKRHAALTALARDRLESTIAEHMAAGMSPVRSVLAVLEGTTRGVADGRVSVAATRLAYESKFVGDMMARILRELPHAPQLLRDEVFLGDVVREMFELKPGGRAGVTGNADAATAAKVFRDYSDLSRRELNKLGAAIGNLEGWAGPQVHDPQRLLAMGEDAWIDYILPKLDQQRTFGRDAVALDDLGRRQGEARTAWLQAGEQQRALLRFAEDGARRLQAMAERQDQLGRRRDALGARLEELARERGAQIGRYMDHLEGGADQIDRARARENAVSETRLRGRTDRQRAAHDRAAGMIEANGQRIRELQDAIAAAAARAEEHGARRLELEQDLQRLALEGDGLRPGIEDPREFLRQAYRTIISGRDNAARPSEPAKGPANLARSLEKHRVLHFRDADSWIEYNRTAGHGRIFDAMIAHQNRSARLAAQMQVMGPNPEATITGVLNGLADRIRNDAAFPEAAKESAIAALSLERRFGSIRAAFDEVRGLSLAPANVTAARIGSSIRAVQSMAKLGGAVISSISDTVTTVANLSYNGVPLGKAWAGQLHELLRGRGDAEQRQIAALVGEGFDGLIGHLVNDSVASDGAPGLVSRSMETFFRWSGLTWWTDARRAGAARMLSAWLGEQVGRPHAELDPKLARVLNLHGIRAPEWEVLRQAQYHAAGGRVYVTGDRVAELADDAIAPLVTVEQRAAAASHFGTDKPTMQQFGREVPVPPERMAQRQAQYDAWLAREIGRRRDDLELAVRRYMADETGFAVIETDEASRRLALLNTAAPSGTVAGEALRFVMQFKGFPIAFTNRVLGRAFVGGQGDTTAQRLLNNAGHIGHLIAGLTLAGYMSMTAKDTLRGWDPRDPKSPQTWLAALQQGGGAGIYGDFLFGQANRFGNSALETVAGPTAATAASLINLWTRARDGNSKAGEYFNIAWQNMPFANLFYVRPALDFLVLNSLKEGMSPGYIAREERRRLKDYDQRRIWPAAPGR